MRVFYIFFLIIALSFQSTSQVPVGQWDIHLNYSNANTVLEVDNIIYVGTKSNLYAYDRDDYGIEIFSVLNGLSSMDISALAHSPEHNLLIIGYRDGNIDLRTNGSVINIPYINMTNTLSEKTINHIFVDDNLAYLSCLFGLVILDIEKSEIKETCYFSNNGINTTVFESFVFDDSIYTPADNFLANKVFVGTSSGLYYANKNDNLLDFSVWQRDSRISFGQGDNDYIISLEEVSIVQVDGVDLKENGGKRLSIGTDLDYEKMDIPLNNGVKYNFFEFNTIAYTEPFSPSLNLFVVNSEVPGEMIDLKYNTNTNYAVTVTNDNFTEKVIVLGECGKDCFDQHSLKNLLSKNTSEINDLNTATNIKSAVLSEDYANNQMVFLGSEKFGLIRGKNSWYDLREISIIAPNGPAAIDQGSIFAHENSILFTHGGITSSWNNTYNYQELSLYKNYMWSQSNQLVDLNIYDAITLSGDPVDENRYFVGTWNSGLLEIIDDSLVNVYNTENSLLQSANEKGWIRIGGLDYDNNNVLWITNSQAEKPLVRFYNNEWQQFTIPNLSTSSMSGDIVCTKNNQYWIQLRNEGLIVAKEQGGGMISKKLGTLNGLASQTVNCFAEDHDGVMWVGTAQGLSVCFNTNSVFNSNYNADYILIETTDGYVERLFENTNILDIEVDGANRKWVATSNNGVFLMSEDGTEEILHFTKENSLLLDNMVSDVSILNNTGEVFFVTGRGLCSYRANATRSREEFDNVTVFPNPVPKDFWGEIVISGLKDNTNVKITDIAGNLVFETFSLGGTATWNGKNFDGRNVSTGVYLFLCVDDLFDKSVVKKVLIYN
ncbi:MAG: hypothetical protein CMD27_01105 [Flavobacteriales bacterium]|nr:hypothetical protein [Flavobacteriales bacterium]